MWGLSSLYVVSLYVVPLYMCPGVSKAAAKAVRTRPRCAGPCSGQGLRWEKRQVGVWAAG